MEENTVKISHILFMILMMGIIIAVGTYAWLSYRSNDTAMVLTIGETNNVQVTLSPYQFKGSLLPQVTYTSDNYVNVTAINNSSSSRKIRLYYKINNIDSELTSSDFKYTIERSTDGTNYSEYKSGNFNGTSNGSELTILEENIPNTTTYNYKVYLWIDSTNSDQSYMQGKSFSGELRAEILSYNVTFDPNGGIVNISNKAVSYGEQYGTLPIPTREGYTFKGWNGKNMLYGMDTIMVTYAKDVIYNVASNNVILTATLDQIGDQIGYVKTSAKVSLKAEKTYIFSCNIDELIFKYTDVSNVQVVLLLNNEYNLSYSLNPDNNGYFEFTPVESGLYWLRLGVKKKGDTHTFSNISIVEKNNSNLENTEYEPFYIRNDTKVVQRQNHTLKAIWEPNS